MAKILTPSTTMLEHYLKLQYTALDFDRICDRVDVTGAATATTTVAAVLTPFVSVNFSTGTKSVYAVVSGVTDQATDTLLTLKDGVTTLGTCTVLAHAGIDSLHKFVMTAPFTATPVVTVTLTGGTAGVFYEILIIDNDPVAWLDMGQNFNEGVTFQDGPLGMPVARGWVAAAFQKRVRNQNTWSVRQMYSSIHEGVANLRGKTIRVRDDVRTDGGSLIKETHYVIAAQVLGVPVAIGSGGQEQADVVDASGYYARRYNINFDALSMTAMA